MDLGLGSRSFGAIWGTEDCGASFGSRRFCWIGGEFKGILSLRAAAGSRGHLGGRIWKFCAHVALAATFDIRAGMTLDGSFGECV